MIKVLSYKLDCATGQLFYIIDTPSRKFPVPIIHLTGSHGNLYKITFTPTKISCSCDDYFNSCKHILYILALLGCPLNLGWVKIFSVEVITLIHSNILNLHILDPDSSTLFLHNKNWDCFVCKALIHAKSNYCFCCHYSSIFIHHAHCSLNNNIRCVNFNQQSAIVLMKCMNL